MGQLGMSLQLMAQTESIMNLTGKPARTSAVRQDIEEYAWLGKCLPIFIGIFIFINPFPHITAIKEICFYLSVVIFFTLFFVKKNILSFRTPLMLPFGLFVLWSFLGLFFALNRSNSIHDFYSHLLRYIILYYMIVNFFASKKRLVALSWIVIISSATFSIGAVIYHYFMLGNKLSEKFAGFAQAPINVISVTVVFGVILSMNNLFDEKKFSRRLVLFGCLFLLSCSMLLFQNLSSIVALFLAVIIIFFNKKRILVGLLGAILIIIAVMPVKNRFLMYSDNLLIALRVGINYHTLEIIKDHPVVGIGFGMHTWSDSLDLKKYYERIPEKYRESIIYDNPHNMFFDIAVRLGLVGFGLCCYIIVVFFKIARACIKNGRNDFIKNWGRCVAAAFLAFLTIGFFHPVFSHMPEVVLCTIFSMATIVWRLNNRAVSAEISR